MLPAPGKTSYFNDLNGLRTIGSVVIFVAHVEYYKFLQGQPHVFGLFTNPSLGSAAVTLFFVLSGFLITWLLLKEKQQKNTIVIRKFYLRRILRLWPLYYFLCLLMFLVVWPNKPFSNDLELIPHEHGMGLAAVLYFTHAANLYFLVPAMFLAHAWTVSVEEQFYLLWPLVVKYARATGKVLLGVFIVLSLVKILFAAYFYFSQAHKTSYTLNIFKEVLYISRYEALALGGYMAYIGLRDEQKRNFLFKKGVQWWVYAFALVYLFTGNKFVFVDQIILAVCFGVFVLNLALNSQSVVRFKNNFLNSLGGYSYGFYLWHPISIASAYYLLIGSFPLTEWTGQVFLYLLSLCISCALTFISYRLIEKPFLKLKPY